MKRIAVIGDCHGRLDLLQKLYKQLEWESLDEIRHSGDLIDRGADSNGVVTFCRKNNIQGVMGNHEEMMIEYLKRDKPSKNPEKIITFNQLRGQTENIKYLESLPYIHTDDELQTFFVHGGLLPKTDIWSQPKNLVCRLALIHPYHMDHTKWFVEDRQGNKEEYWRDRGYSRWYELWDHPYRVVYGHNVYQHGPFVHKNGDSGETIGVDTGAVWSGVLTAVILPDLTFVSTPKEKEFTKWHDAWEKRNKQP